MEEDSCMHEEFSEQDLFWAGRNRSVSRKAFLLSIILVISISINVYAILRILGPVPGSERSMYSEPPKRGFTALG